MQMTEQFIPHLQLHILHHHGCPKNMCTDIHARNSNSIDFSKFHF